MVSTPGVEPGIEEEVRFQLLPSPGTRLLQCPVPCFPSFLQGRTALLSLQKAAFLFSPSLTWTLLKGFMFLGALLSEPY